MKILVCGGRDYDNQTRLWSILTDLDPSSVVHGAARGADYLADAWCWKTNTPYHRHPAAWQKWGRAAGAIRNKEMLDEHPDIELVVAFPTLNSIGTWHMVHLAESRDIPVMVVDNPNPLEPY